VNYNVSLKTKVHGFPKYVSSFAGDPLNLSPIPIYALLCPVRDPTNPDQAILAKGTDPCSVGWYTATTPYLLIGACSSQSKHLI